MMCPQSVAEQMVAWFGFVDTPFVVSWHALQSLGLSGLVDLLDPKKPDLEFDLSLSDAFMGSFNLIREWAKNKKHQRCEEGGGKMGIWEVFRELRPQHLEMEKKIRYSRRFWSRLFAIQCMSLKALKVFESVGVPADYQNSSSLIAFLFSDKMPSFMSRIRNNKHYNGTKAVYRDLHLFDVILVMDLMIINRVKIPMQQPVRNAERH